MKENMFEITNSSLIFYSGNGLLYGRMLHI